MIIISLVAAIAAVFGAASGYALSKQAVEWCPTCGRSLAGHCPQTPAGAGVHREPVRSSAGRR